MFSKVGIVGLGRMGLAMAERFIETGIETVGTDVSDAARNAAWERGVGVVGTASEVFEAADVVVLSLPTAQDVQTVLAGLLQSSAGRDLYIIDTTTSDPAVTRDLEAKLSSRNVHLIDAPVSGGFFGARSGTLGIMVGGDQQHLETVRGVLERIGTKIMLMGGPGSGHATKLLNNLLGAANLLVTTELMRMATSQGLDPAKTIAALNAGTAKNSATEFNYPKWVLNRQFDSGFSIRLMRKDVRLAQRLVGDAGVPLPILDAIAQIWNDSERSIPNGADFNQIVDFHPGGGD